MADPRPLTREELAKFLPNQRAIRAFEKLFDLIPPELEDILLIAESAYSATNSSRIVENQLREEILWLRLEILTMGKRLSSLNQLENRVSALETLQG